MLDCLEEVSWDELTHAYGSASDVPGILRSVAAGDEEALGQLYGNIWHQGTVYEATAPTVPFLVELLEEKKADTAELLALLRSIAIGSSYMDVHRDLQPRARRRSEETERQIARELGWVRAAHDAVVDGAPGYLRHLVRGTEQTRSAAGWVLGTCTEAADRIVPVLLERLQQDDSGVVRGSILFALDALGAGADGQLARWLEDVDPTPRVVAALVAARQKSPLPERVGRILESGVPEAREALERLEWTSRDEGDVLASLVYRLRDRRDLQISLLTAWMQHEDVGFREEAVFATETVMHEYRPAAGRLVPELAKRLTDPGPKVRYWAASCLASAGRAATQAADALWALLQREPLEHNSPSSFALSGLCRQRDRRAALYLRHVWEGCLRSRSKVPEPTVSALEWLGSWAEPCRDVLVRLIPFVDAGNPTIRVIKAVGDYGETAIEALPALRAEIDTHPRIVTRVLGDWGRAAAPALPEIERQLHHNDAQVRLNAARAVWRATDRTDVAISVVRAELERSDHERRFALSSALELLAEMGPVAGVLAEDLPPFFDADDEWISLRSAVAHWRLVADPPAVLHVLLDHVECVPCGFEAVRCLAEIGPPARAVLSRLREAVESQERQVVTGSTETWIEMDEKWQTLCRQAIASIEQ